jgi:hypothetical protein
MGFNDQQYRAAISASMKQSPVIHAASTIRTAPSSKLVLVFLAVFALAMAASWAATFSVTSTNDSGPGSLREALANVNASPGPHLVQFSLPGKGVCTLAPLTPLPDITNHNFEVQGTLDSQPNTTFRLEFFAAVPVVLVSPENVSLATTRDGNTETVSWPSAAIGYQPALAGAPGVAPARPDLAAQPTPGAVSRLRNWASCGMDNHARRFAAKG